jgi:hypothetical protein
VPWPKGKSSHCVLHVALATDECFLQAINDRIKDLDFHDTKVRVTNVDSQGSDANIVIQVIGEISNKGQPHKRFVQTFVLAEQTNGYFVLNDIFRYLAEELEEEEEQLQNDPVVHDGVQEPSPTAAVVEDEPVSENAVAENEEDLSKVDHKLEEVAQEEPAEEASPPPAVNGTPVPEDAEVVEAEDAPAAAVSTSEESSAQEPEKPVQEVTEPEKVQEPAPTPAKAAPKAAPAPSGPPKPATPRTWANLAASAHKVATPAVPAQSTPQTASQPKAAAPAPSQTTTAPSAQVSTPAREASPSNSQGDSEWQSVTAHKKEQARAQNQGPASEPDQKRAYIKNVYSQVDEVSLKSAMSKFGDVEYLDISRQKNCAFVDFKTPAGFQNAVKNNPHTIAGIEIKVEERRLRPNFNAPFSRGGGAPRGRGGVGGQGGPRGGFQPRGGRGGSISRGTPRGAPQEA